MCNAIVCLAKKFIKVYRYLDGNLTQIFYILADVAYVTCWELQ